jgi:hypothetical protein
MCLASFNVREVGYKIKHISTAQIVSASLELDDGPGGRHDNDFVNFHDISILPTRDKLLAEEKPFLHQSSALDDPDTEGDHETIHCNNHFQLLQEDMLCELQDDVHITCRMKKGKYHGMVINKLILLGAHTQFSNGKKCKWGIAFECCADLPQLRRAKPKDRKAFLNNN